MVKNVAEEVKSQSTNKGGSLGGSGCSDVRSNHAVRFADAVQSSACC